jgi:hypothetical protein
VSFPQPHCTHVSSEERPNSISSPPYERFEHWNRCLEAARLEFEGLEQEWRERENGLAGDFEGRVRSGIEGLEGLLAELKVVE